MTAPEEFGQAVQHDFASDLLGTVTASPAIETMIMVSPGSASSGQGGESLSGRRCGP